MPPPQVSVVVPVFNASATLRGCVDSLRAQTMTDWDAWLVDDGSTDNSWELMQELASVDSRIHLLRQPNRKQAAARNHALRYARGRYVALLDSDDKALPRRFELQVEFLENNPTVTVLGGSRIDVDSESGEQVGSFSHPEEHETLCDQIYTCCPFSTSTIMARREFFGAWIFDESATPCEDHDLWLRSVRDPAVRFHNILDPLVIYSRRKKMSWHHYSQIAAMYVRALKREGMWPRRAWIALRPWVAALYFNFMRRG